MPVENLHYKRTPGLPHFPESQAKSILSEDKLLPCKSGHPDSPTVWQNKSLVIATPWCL